MNIRCLSYVMGTVAIAGALLFPAKSKATTYTDVKPDNTEALATVVNSFSNGDSLSGSFYSSTGASFDNDYWKLNLASQGSTAIYLNTLTFSATSMASVGEIHGQHSPNAAAYPYPPEEIILQNRVGGGGTGGLQDFNQFYTFGAPTSLYYNVGGDTTAVGNADPALAPTYSVTLAQSVVTPQTVSQTFQPGAITITSVGKTGASQTDTEFWVYDQNLNAIANFGNDNTPGGNGGSALTRTLGPGTYTVAISTRFIANNYPTSSNLSEEEYGTQANPIADAAGILVKNDDGQTNANVSFAISDANGDAANVSATKVNQLDVEFVQFTVVPEPSTLTFLIIGGSAGAMLMMRRRAKEKMAQAKSAN